jgi:hypothetical protein
MFCSYLFYSFADDPICELHQRSADDDAWRYICENGFLK